MMIAMVSDFQPYEMCYYSSFHSDASDYADYDSDLGELPVSSGAVNADPYAGKHATRKVRNYPVLLQYQEYSSPRIGGKK